jgi:hypothetical protein
MRDNFVNDREDYIDIGPHGGKRFSYHVWNKQLLPLARKLSKLQHVKRVRIHYDYSKGPCYGVTAFTCTYTGSGYVFGIRPVQANTVKVTGRDIGSNTFLEFDHWDEIWEHVKAVPATQRPIN